MSEQIIKYITQVLGNCTPEMLDAYMEADGSGDNGLTLDRENKKKND